MEQTTIIPPSYLPMVVEAEQTTNRQNREKTMINLPRIVMALFGISAVLDIAEKIHNWGRDKKNKKEDEKKEDEPSRV